MYKIHDMYKKIEIEKGIYKRCTITEKRNNQIPNLPSYAESFSKPFLELKSGERRGWWGMTDKDPSVMPPFIVEGTIGKCKTNIIIDSDVGVSVMSISFAQALALKIKKKKIPETLRGSAFRPFGLLVAGKARVRVNLLDSMMYVMEVWIVNITQPIILGSDFMKAAGIRTEFGNTTARLPGEICLSGGGMKLTPILPTAREVCVDTAKFIRPGRSCKFKINEWEQGNESTILWVRQVKGLVPRVMLNADKKASSIVLHNLTTRIKLLQERTAIAIWLPNGEISDEPGYVRICSPNYACWQNRIYENGIMLPENDITEMITLEEHKPSPKKILLRSGLKFLDKNDAEKEKKGPYQFVTSGG